MSEDNPYSEGEICIRFPIHLKDKVKEILDGEKYKFALQELDNHLRGIYKHSDDEKAQEEAEKMRDLLREYLAIWDLTIWD
jgi:hypothetical protein